MLDTNNATLRDQRHDGIERHERMRHVRENVDKHPYPGMVCDTCPTEPPVTEEE